MLQLRAAFNSLPARAPGSQRRAAVLPLAVLVGAPGTRPRSPPVG